MVQLVSVNKCNQPCKQTEIQKLKIILLDVEAFDKNQQTFMITVLERLGILYGYGYIIRAGDRKPIANNLNREKVKPVILQSGTRQGHLLPSYLLNIVLEVSASEIKELKKRK